jgi:hypothetical protein
VAASPFDVGMGAAPVEASAGSLAGPASLLHPRGSGIRASPTTGARAQWAVGGSFRLGIADGSQNLTHLIVDVSVAIWICALQIGNVVTSLSFPFDRQQTFQRFHVSRPSSFGLIPHLAQAHLDLIEEVSVCQKLGVLGSKRVEVFQVAWNQ